MIDYTGCIPKTSKEAFLTGTNEGRRALQAYGLGDYGCGISRVGQKYEIHRKKANAHGIFYTLGGQADLYAEDRHYVLKPGLVAILPAGGTHTYRARSSWELLWFHPSNSEIWNGVIPKHPIVAKAVWAAQLEALTQDFLKESVKRERSLHESVLRGYSHLISLFLQRELSVLNHAQKPEKREKLEKLWAAVTEAPAHPWDVHNLAKSCAVSRSQLHSLVKQYYGCGVMEVVGKIRMEYAEELIINRQFKIIDVANRVGYTSPYSFSRAFKRFIGVAPENYRREHRSL